MKEPFIVVVTIEGSESFNQPQRVAPSLSNIRANTAKPASLYTDIWLQSQVGRGFQAWASFGLCSAGYVSGGAYSPSAIQFMKAGDQFMKAWPFSYHFRRD